MNIKIMLSAVLCFSVMHSGECAGISEGETRDAAVGTHAAVTPVPRPNQAGWMPRHLAIVERVAQGNIDLLMIGDSITYGWKTRGKETWDQYYAPRNAVNLGFGGDRTEHVLWRLANGEIDNINPKLAVLLIGTNNSSRDTCTAEQIADGIKAIVRKLRAKLPETKILILAIFPRGDQNQRKNKEPVTANMIWDKNNRASRLASEIADGKMIFYLDINQAFLNEKGQLTREVMPDLLHPGERGYQLWAKAMEPTIAWLMGETQHAPAPR